MREKRVRGVCGLARVPPPSAAICTFVLVQLVKRVHWTPPTDLDAREACASLRACRRGLREAERVSVFVILY